ncbi:MAG: aminotransferase class III-fold pyridoxal phosphate-dependent enzyme [Lysobacterales bacterium]
MTSLLERRNAATPASLKLSYKRPLALVRGERHFLFDEDGHRYLDAYNNVPHVGHAHPVVVEAVHRQMSMLNTNTRYLQDIHVAFCERLLALLPDSLTRILLTSSASEANELAMRLSRVATSHHDMVVMDHGYHGSTTGAMAISPYKHRETPSAYQKPDWVHVVAQPDVFRGQHRGDGAGQVYADEAKQTLDELCRQGHHPAAFFSECLPSVGGQIVLPDNYLSSVYAAVRDAGGICVADDVQTALGRLGHWFWGFEQQAVIPDIVVLGKPLGNGFPLAAVAMTEEIAQAFNAGPEYFSTFGGSSAACAAGNAVLEVLQTEDLQTNARSNGQQMFTALESMKDRHECIGDVRGFGLFLGVDLVEDRDTREPATELAHKVVNGLRDSRILIGVEGPHHNVLKIRPPMTFDAEAVEEVLTALDQQLS